MDLAVWHTAAVFHVGDVVRKLRDLADWSQTELGARADLNKDTIKRIEAGEKPRVESLEKIARALGVTLSDLYRQTTIETGPEHINEADPIDIDIGQYVRGDIPVLGYAEASTDGLIAWTDEGIVRNQVDQWISRPSWIRDKKAYALIVRGDSMIPRYLPGELIIASPNAVISTGAYACVILKSGERMIKQVYKEQNGWNLISSNGKYPPKFVRHEDVVAVHKIVHNSQDAISVSKEEMANRVRTAKAPKGVKAFVEELRNDATDADPKEPPED